MGPYELPEREGAQPEDRITDRSAQGQQQPEGRSGKYRPGDPDAPREGSFDDDADVPDIRLSDPNRGVAGWLLFFCVVLTIISPIVSVIALGVAYAEAAPAFELFPGLRRIMIVDAVLSVGLIAFSMYAGIGLWTIRPGAVRTAKAFLVTVLIYHVIASMLPFTAELPAEANQALMEEMLKESFRALVFFAIWFSFLNVSKRVKATYES